MSDQPTWDGVPTCDGWHWLRHRGRGDYRMGFYTGRYWRVADAIGRTVILADGVVARRYTYYACVEPPA